MGHGENLFFLHGISGTGVSHLLQATANLSSELQQQAFYFSLAEPELTLEVLEQLDIFDVLCIDNIEFVANQADWEEALFHLFNQFRDSGKRLIIGSKSLPENTQIKLPDLVSRLSGMVRYQLKVISDEDKNLAIIKRAKNYGLVITPEVANFMLTRGPRDLREIIGCVDKLDQASMISKRGITIPLVKEVFGW
jgi:DnaA family protein